HAGAQAEPFAGSGHEGQQDVRLLPQDVRIEEPHVVEAGGLCAPRERKGPLDRVIRLERESETHCPSPAGRWVFEAGSVHRATLAGFPLASRGFPRYPDRSPEGTDRLRRRSEMARTRRVRLFVAAVVIAAALGTAAP